MKLRMIIGTILTTAPTGVVIGYGIAALGMWKEIGIVALVLIPTALGVYLLVKE